MAASRAIKRAKCALRSRSYEPLLDVPVVYADELLTSAIADRVLADSGVSARERRGKLDAIAASIMLQGYLDDHPLDRAGDGHRAT